MLVEGRIVPVTRPAMVVGKLGTTGLAITQALRLLGFQQVDEARTVENAIERLGPVPYGLILCDVGTEHLEGFAFLNRLRADPFTAVIPFIFVSGQRSAAFAERARTAGATGYILKSFGPYELVGFIRRILTAPPEEAFSALSALPSLHTAEDVIFGPEEAPLH